jgi:hypothetical protein
LGGTDSPHELIYHSKMSFNKRFFADAPAAVYMKYIFAIALSFVLIGLAPIAATAQVVEITQSPEFSAKDLKKLKWIIGDWKGTGDSDKPFYERYRFENATTLAVDELKDESDLKGGNTTRFILENGSFGNSGASRWMAAAITRNSITFIPVAGARNSFTWEKVSKNEWRAILNWPPAGDKPARKRVYKMERIVRN